jgi:hypothetical protein
MKNVKLFVLAALILMMLLVACGGGPTAQQPTADTSTTSETATGSQPEATTVVEVGAPTPEPTTEAAPTEATEGDLNMDSVSTGLTALKSYKSKLDMHFVGKDAQGQDVDKSWTMEEAYIGEPASQDVLWTSSESTAGQAPKVTTWENITIGQTSYMISTDESGARTCISISSADAQPPEQLLSADMWGGISDAKYTGKENVNGVETKHYVWKEGALAPFGFSLGKGETWVAVDGEYVVRQKVEATGKDVFMAGTDEEGTTTWQWDVTDANGSFEIVAPEGCESGAKDLPIMIDAMDLLTMGDSINYNSSSPFADIVNFYKDEMPKAGWQLNGTPTEMEGLATFEYTKEGNTATVFISYDASSQKTSVVVSVVKP